VAFVFAGFSNEVYENENRALLRNEPVTVYLPGTTTKATLYSSRTKATTVANPFTTDEFGNGAFFADPGTYDVLFNGFTTTVTVPIDPEEAAQDTDLSAYATTVALNAEAGARTAADTAETAARALADEVLADGLDDETADRTAAVSAEATARANADASLAADIVTEASARALADTTEVTARDAAIEIHRLDTTAVHGIPDTSVLENTTGAQAKVDAAAATLIPLSQKGAADGVATLGPDGKLPSAQLPALAIGETSVVVSEAAMLALTAQRGDVAVRTDLDPDGVFILTADDPTVLANWVQITAPGAVVSVNGESGAVVLPVDGAAGTASLRTLGTGAAQALAGNTPVATTADLVVEATARTSADALLIPLSQKAAASGVASLDESSRVAQDPKLHADQHREGAVDDLTWWEKLSSARQDGFPRLLAQGNSTATAGTVFYVPFEPVVDRLVSGMTVVGGTTAGVGMTLVRLALCVVEPDGDLTVVARTASDATMFTTVSTAYTRAFGSADGFPLTYQLTKGTEYAFALLTVGAITAPTVRSGAVTAALALLSPTISFARSGQTDIPTTASPSFSSTSTALWMAAS